MGHTCGENNNNEHKLILLQRETQQHTDLARINVFLEMLKQIPTFAVDVKANPNLGLLQR